MNIAICEMFGATAHFIQMCEIIKFLKSKGHKCRLYNMILGKIYRYKKDEFDIILISYASFYFNFIEINKLININPNAKIFWVTNEYDIRLNNSIITNIENQKREISVIANFIEKTNPLKKCKNFYHLNLNLLFFRERKPVEKKYDCCYYGTYRKNRAEYFKKYFTDNNFFVSSSSKNIKKFKTLNCKFKPLNLFKWSDDFNKPNTLSYFKFTLYIEDKYTHTHFNNLADRFYEALSSQCVILFDKSCENTLNKSEIKDENFQDFLINSPDDFKNRDFEKDLKKQSLWIPKIKELREQLLIDFETILLKS